MMNIIQGHRLIGGDVVSIFFWLQKKLLVFVQFIWISIGKDGKIVRIDCGVGFVRHSYLIEFKNVRTDSGVGFLRHWAYLYCEALRLLKSVSTFITLLASWIFRLAILPLFSLIGGFFL